jgi:hypothetical protein
LRPYWVTTDSSACRIKASASHIARFDAAGSAGLLLRTAMTSADLECNRPAEHSISRCETHLGLCDRLSYATWPASWASSCDDRLCRGRARHQRDGRESARLIR